MATLTITLADSGFPVNFSGNLTDFKNAILANTTASINSDNLILGKIGGSAPISDIGPWLDGRTWKAWNGSGYAPVDFRVGTANFSTLFSASLLTANRTITVPDKDGTLALTSNSYGERPTVVLTGTAPTADWSASNNFYELLTGATTVKMSNSLPGQEIALAMVNSGTSYSVSWTGVNWGGANPTQSSSATDLYILKNVAGTIYGRQIAGY